MALGRGLSELLGEIETAYDNNTDKNTIKEIEVSKIIPNPYQPRKIFDEQQIQELSDSIVSHGLLQPIVVRIDGDNYTLIAGERRLRASKLVDIKYIKAVILDIEEKELREYALIENIQRKDLNILEIAYSYGSLINEHNITHEELSKIVHKSRSSITNILRLLNLSVYAQQMISSDKITLGHAKLIVGLNEDEQKIVVDSIIGQQLSVRETEKIVKNFKEKDITVKKQPKISKYNFDILKPIINKFQENNLKIKITSDSFNIKITSDEDIEKILHLFNKNNLT